MRRSLRLLIATAALAMAGCAGGLADLVSLQRDLLEAYPGADITVKMTDRQRLSIAVRNTEVSGAPGEEQEEAARALGRLVLQHYAGASRLTEVAIVFGTSENAGRLAITTDLHSYTYTPEQLSDSTPAPNGEVVEAAQVAS